MGTPARVDYEGLVFSSILHFMNLGVDILKKMCGCSNRILPVVCHRLRFPRVLPNGDDINQTEWTFHEVEAPQPPLKARPAARRPQPDTRSPSNNK